MRQIQYPSTPMIDQQDTYHGTEVPDPYRWLENTDSTETKTWIETQNSLTQSFLGDVISREYIKQRLSSLWDMPRSLAPRKVNGKYFQLENTGLQDHDALYVMDTIGECKKLLLDPNTLSPDGTVALNNWEVSNDAALLAYAVSASGSDWQVWRIRDVVTGEDLSDKIEWSKFSNIAWAPDNAGFYYSRYDEPLEGEEFESVNLNQKVYFHTLGTSQSEDQLIYQRPDKPEWGFEALISHDGDYLLLHVSKGTDVRNRLFYRRLESKWDFIELIPNLEARYQYIYNDGHQFYLMTNYQAPRGRLIAIDLKDPDRKSWKTIIPEIEDTLETIKIIGLQFITIYLHNAHHQIKRFDLTGDFIGEIPLPTIGSIHSLDRENYIFGEPDDEECFFTFNSFIVPPTVMRYSVGNDICETISSPEIDFDPTSFQINQVFVKSEDGTQVPMFLVYHKSFEKGKSNPALLYGYGGFNISITPNFMVGRLVWLELGGVLAIANLRGGGEFGEEWHSGGSLLNKQNVFDDMISCAEYLILEGFTTPKNLVIEGRSNGGLLVGACINQRPDLFGAALPAVGVMDMLRFHKFTIGWAWVSDYGSVDDPEQFKVLYSYSPLHNINPGTSYPATLVTTADHDDRVVPGHSFKFIAALQAAQAGDAPVLIRIQTKSGHGFGKPISLQIEEQADIYTFLVKVLNIQIPQSQ
jgi:prolyl oligopeptidase